MLNILPGILAGNKSDSKKELARISINTSILARDLLRFWKDCLAESLY